MRYTRDDAGVTARLAPKLLDQVRGGLRLRHYSLRTEQAYVGWIRRFILANGKRHPVQMGLAEGEAFLTELATRGQVSAGTQNQALAALLFLYRDVLVVDLPWMEHLVRAKRPRRIPVMLSVEEVARLLTMLEGYCRLMAGLLYGSGMRLLECLRLWIKDVDMVLGEIVVCDDKRGKDRRVPLPRSLRGELMQQRARALLLHAADLAEGAGRVFLPHALARKYPHADVAPGWQYLFPRCASIVGSAQWPSGPASRVGGNAAARGAGGTVPCRHRQAGDLPHAAPFLRHAPAESRPRDPHRAGAVGPQGCGHHADLHACAGARGLRGAQSVGWAGRRRRVTLPPRTATQLWACVVTRRD